MSFYKYNPILSFKPPAPSPRRKVFISYFKNDKPWVDKLVNDYGQSGTGVFIPRALGVKEEDDFVNSDNVDYIMQAIRDRYIGDTSVTIVVIGSCTHSRKFIDWEIKSSLRQPANGIPNGLLGLAIPPTLDLAGNPIWHNLPDRFLKNYIQNSHDTSYAKYYVWPTNASDLKQWIEEAYELASKKANIIENTQEMPRRNLICKVHNTVHTI